MGSRCGRNWKFLTLAICLVVINLGGLYVFSESSVGRVERCEFPTLKKDEHHSKGGKFTQGSLAALCRLLVEVVMPVCTCTMEVVHTISCLCIHKFISSLERKQNFLWNPDFLWFQQIHSTRSGLQF